VGLVAASYAVLGYAGVNGLALVIALWALALPYFTRRPVATLRGEVVGALTVFLVAGNADTASFVAGDPYAIGPWAIIALGLLYLAMRPLKTAAVLGHPVVRALACFLLWQVLSPVLTEGDTGLVLQNRATYFLALVVAAVLTKREGGA